MLLSYCLSSPVQSIQVRCSYRGGQLVSSSSSPSSSRSALAPYAPDPRPHAAAIIAINDVISVLSIILSYLYAGATPPASSPDTCALSVPTVAVLLQLRSLPAFLPCLVLLPPKKKLCTTSPAHLRERTHPNPLPLPQTMN